MGFWLKYDSKKMILLFLQPYNSTLKAIRKFQVFGIILKNRALMGGSIS